MGSRGAAPKENFGTEHSLIGRTWGRFAALSCFSLSLPHPASEPSSEETFFASTATLNVAPNPTLMVLLCIYTYVTCASVMQDMRVIPHAVTAVENTRNYAHALLSYFISFRGSWGLGAT